MGGTERLWLLASICQVAFLTCERHLHPVEVAVVFSSSPRIHSLVCTDARNHVVYEVPVDNSTCSQNCRISLQLVDDPSGYNVTLRSNYDLTEESSFHFVPVSVSSLHLSSTTTSAFLSWSINKQQSLSSLSLYNMHTGSLTHVFDINSSEEQSQIKVNELRPATRYKAQIVVTTFQKSLNVTLEQKLSARMETGHCHAGWLAGGRSCYSVRRTSLAWRDAQNSCNRQPVGGHLADVRSLEDPILTHLLGHNNLLLLWTGLKDRQGLTHLSACNQTNSLTALPPAYDRDCFALQKNVTGPGFFLIPFFCSIPLPFICQYQIPPVLNQITFQLVQVTERQAELRWGDLSPLNGSSLEAFLQYQEEMDDRSRATTGDNKIIHRLRVQKRVKVPIALSSRGVTVAGLSPGRIYSFTLQTSHSAGATLTLGQVQTAYTRPKHPQNVTVGSVTSTQIALHWSMAGSGDMTGWRFSVRYMDMTVKQEWTVETISASNGLQSYSAVIDRLQSYTQYKVEVNTVTRYGIESCEPLPLTVRTALSPARDLQVFTTSQNLTACWTPGNHLDAYCIFRRPVDSTFSLSFSINQSDPGARWVNKSMCVDLGGFHPGQTCEIGVVAVRGNHTSKRSSVIFTTEPLPVEIAIPLSVDTTSAELHVQSPRFGEIDGVKVCVCPEACHLICEDLCGYTCEWHPIYSSYSIVNVTNLSPGSIHQLVVHSTSRQVSGPPYYTRTFRTSLAPPRRVREGEVTDTSVQLLWDAALGHSHHYEVICSDCDYSPVVQKVFSQSAVFSSLTPGKSVHFTLRTEKESFTDSSSVTINITSAPSQVNVSLVNKTTSSICVRWSVIRGLVGGFILSIKNGAHNQDLITVDAGGRLHTFEDLIPGFKYKIEVISRSGERESSPAVIHLNTKSCKVSSNNFLPRSYYVCCASQSRDATATCCPVYLGFDSNAKKVANYNREYYWVKNELLGRVPDRVQGVSLPEQVDSSAFITWRPPPGQVDGYKLNWGLLSLDQESWAEVFVSGTSYDIRDLSPGSDYCVSIQSVRDLDTGDSVERVFSTRPAGMCSLQLVRVNSSSVSVGWNFASGEFDFHRVTVANTSVTNTLTIPKEERVAVVTGLLDGCSYNISAVRVRGVTAGSAAFLSVTTVPASVQDLHVISVTERAFSLLWEQPLGCVDRFQVTLLPERGQVTVHPARDGYVQVIFSLTQFRLKKTLQV